MFIGTSGIRAAALVELGWDKPLPTTSLIEAREQARLDSAVDKEPPIVLLQKAFANGDIRFEFYEVCADTPATRLGFSETAGIVDIISSILDNAHTHLRNAIDIGRGEKNIEIPSLRGLLRRKDDDDEPWYDYKTGKWRAAKKKSSAPSIGAIKRAHQMGMSHLNKIKSTLNKWMKKGKQSTAPTAPGISKPKRIPRAPRANGNSVPRVAQVPKAKRGPFGPANPNPAAPKTAGQNIKISGRINGKSTSVTIKPGEDYSVIPTSAGHILKRLGQPPMIISPGAAAKL